MRYKAWQRDYKWKAHQNWEQTLNRQEFRTLLAAEEFQEVASRAERIAPANEGSDMAGADGIRIYRTSGQHFFLKPMVTRRAAAEYGFPFEYRSRPSWIICQRSLPRRYRPP